MFLSNSTFREIKDGKVYDFLWSGEYTDLYKSLRQKQKTEGEDNAASNVYAPYSNTYGPYSNTYAPYTNFYSPFGNSFNLYFSGASSIANGNGPYNEDSVIDYPSYLSNYGYDSRFFTPHSLGQEFGAGTQVGYPGMPGSYRIRIIGALHAESTAPGTPGAYASALSLSGHNGQNGGSFAGKKKK
ncbi:hypothetical protein Btru_017195 [Bulinus truncatus]|nr:hypothetical protein Btru_017195 [Bulinus truncatus]